jgi:tetratricopeptide (TPR) repeat protein
VKTTELKATSNAKNPQNVRVVCVCVFLALAVLAVFGQTARFGFVNYDDEVYVYENPMVQNGLTWKGVVWALTYGQIGHWHPLTWLTHMADCQVYGLWAGGHHLTNVALHAVTAVLLFLVLRAMTGALWRSAFVAAVFAIHPLRAESVAWIAERKDVLSGMFFMLTLWAYARYARQPSRRRYAAAAVWFGLGLLSKNTLVTLPFVLLLLDWWPLGRMNGMQNVEWGEPRSLGVPFWELVKEKIPLFLLSAGSCVATALVPEKVPAGHQLALWLRFENALVSYVTYLRQMVFPAGLANPYPYPSYGASLWRGALAFVLLAAICAGAFACRKKSPFLLVGWLWFLGMMLPVIGIVQISYYAHADRYTYLPEIGLALAGTWAVGDWSVGWKHRRVVLGGLMAVVIGALMVCARNQTLYWKDGETLWRRALACTSGNSYASYHLANVLQVLGRLDESIVYYQKTLEMTPNDVQAECEMGVALMEQGNTPKAIACFHRALEIQPNYVKAHCNLGDALLRQGHTDEAVACFQKALEIQPDYAKAHYDLANVLFDQGHLDQAIAHYQKALEADPGFVEAHFNLGNALLNSGRFDEAVAQYKKVLELQPAYGGAFNNLGTAYTQLGRVSEAMGAYRKALDLQPENTDALNNLAWALATCPQAALRDGAAALALAKKGVQLTGDKNPLLLRTLAAAYAETGSYGMAAVTARPALELAVAQKNDALAAALQKEIKLYEADTPVRESAMDRSQMARPREAPQRGEPSARDVTQ